MHRETSTLELQEAKMMTDLTEGTSVTYEKNQTQNKR